MKKLLIIISNRLFRLTGNIFKTLAYPFHWVLPKKRFTIPEYSPAIVRSSSLSQVPKILWQTNYSNKVTFPVYVNYLFNRLMSMEYEYRYASDEAQDEYIKEHTSERTYQAYLKLNDGAAKADFWRLIVLNTDGGVYLDMDASLVRPLKKLLDENDNALYISLAKTNDITNFFMATAPNNPDYDDIIEQMINNIEERKIEQHVYYLTGPGVFTEVLKDRPIKCTDRKFVCIQGAFTNEHFQYLDKPRGKWTHKKTDDLLK